MATLATAARVISKDWISQFGAFVDFMLQNDVEVEFFGSETIHGIFLGYHIQPGGLWNGDYIVADYEPFKKIATCWKARSKSTESKRYLKTSARSSPSLSPKCAGEGVYETKTTTSQMRSPTLTKTATPTTTRVVKRLPTTTQNQLRSYLRRQESPQESTNGG